MPHPVFLGLREDKTVDDLKKEDKRQNTKNSLAGVDVDMSVEEKKDNGQQVDDAAGWSDEHKNKIFKASPIDSPIQKPNKTYTSNNA